MSLEEQIDSAWERRAELNAAEIASLKPALEAVLDSLESGERRVAEPDGQGGWRLHQWLKKAVLLYFRANGNRVMDAAPAPYFDKVPLRFEGFDETRFRELGARAVPGAVVRRGVHKIAVYRDEAGALHEMSARCTHLGCAVRWNVQDASRISSNSPS